MRGADHQIRIVVGVEVRSTGDGESESANFRVKLIGVNDLGGDFVDAPGTASENEHGPVPIVLAPELASIGSAHGQVVVAVQINVAERGQGSAKTASSLNPFQNVP